MLLLCGSPLGLSSTDQGMYLVDLYSLADVPWAVPPMTFWVLRNFFLT